LLVDVPSMEGLGLGTLETQAERRADTGGDASSERPTHTKNDRRDRDGMNANANRV
jgi:hypothetical protein